MPSECQEGNRGPKKHIAHCCFYSNLLLATEWVRHPICVDKTAAAAAKLLQSCPTLCDPTDGSPLGSTVSGILQARTLEWLAMSFSNA